MHRAYNVISNIFGSHIKSYIENLNSLGNVCATMNGPYYITCVFCKFLNNMYVVVKTLHVVVKKHYHIIIVNNNMYVVMFLILKN